VGSGLLTVSNSGPDGSAVKKEKAFVGSDGVGPDAVESGMGVGFCE
jgi:hypothetical protein